MFVDSHCHLDRLDLTPYDNKLDVALTAAKDNGVEYFLCVCIDLENFAAVHAIAKNYPNISASVGVHPNEQDCQEPSVAELVRLADDPLIVAIGETGLDYYRSEGDVEWQRERFRTHIRAACECNKPLIIHTRQAHADTIEIMRQEGAQQVGGVMHCFTEDYTMAQQAMDLGFYISFSGIVTFKNAVELKEVAQKIPMDKMLIETDSPYLAPVPYRGKPNEPAYVKYVAEHIAELRSITVEEVGSKTSQNFYKLFLNKE